MSVPTHLVGKRVGNNRIELVSLIGEGSYGAVYRGIIHRRGLKTPKQCAVKVLRTTTNEHHILFQRRELELHKRVSEGDGIVTLYESFTEGSYHFIVMKFYRDGNLWYGINRGRYLGNDALIKDIFTQILDATHYCHSRGVFHRDIKPENVMLCNGGHRALLADFGLATGERVSSETCSGSPWYMSPECWGGLAGAWNKPYATAPNDVWSLGVLLINLACGRRAPWEYAHQKDHFYRDFIQQPNLLRLFVPLSPDVHDVLARIFVPNPSNRISIGDLRIAIQNIKHFTIPAERRGEYRDYQRAVWKATVVDSSFSRRLSLRPARIHLAAPAASSTPAIGEIDAADTDRRSGRVVFGSAPAEPDWSGNMRDTSRYMVLTDDPASLEPPMLPPSSWSTSSENSDGPTTPEMLASIPNIEVPDLADVSPSPSHDLPQCILTLPLAPFAVKSQRLAPANSWQSVLDAISAL